MKVRDLMQSPVVTVAPDLSLSDMVECFRRQQIRGAPVVDQGQLVGVISLSDLARENHLNQQMVENEFYVNPSWGSIEVELRDLSEQKVADLMTSRVVSVEADSEVVEAVEVLLNHRIHRLIVVNRGEVTGILSVTDLVLLLRNMLRGQDSLHRK